MTPLLALAVVGCTWLGAYAYVGGMLPARYTVGDRQTWGLVLRSGIATIAAIVVFVLFVL